MGPLLELAIAMLLVAANAFFVASEFAMVKMRRSRLEHLTEKGDRRARTALAISNHLDAYLSANQLGITLASLALGWLGEEAFTTLIAPGVGRAIGVTLSFIVITFLHTVVGELAPKSLAIQRTEPVALWTAIPLRGFYVCAYPVIWVLNTAAARVLALFGLKPASEIEAAHSPEELRMLVRHVALVPGAQHMIDRVFDYTQHRARHVMTLRDDVVALDARGSFADNVRVAAAAQYTRYPLLDGSDVLGYVHLKDLFAAMSERREPAIRTLARAPLTVEEETPLDEVRRAMLNRRIHLVVVRGPGGAFTGILTLDDVLEGVVGEIRDEQDGSEPLHFAPTPNGFEADGRLTLDVLQRELGLILPDANDIETIGGYVMTALGRTAAVGDVIVAAGLKLSVIAVRGRRIVRVQAERISAE